MIDRATFFACVSLSVLIIHGPLIAFAMPPPESLFDAFLGFITVSSTLTLELYIISRMVCAIPSASRHTAVLDRFWNSTRGIITFAFIGLFWVLQALGIWYRALMEVIRIDPAPLDDIRRSLQRLLPFHSFWLAFLIALVAFIFYTALIIVLIIAWIRNIFAGLRRIVLRGQRSVEEWKTDKSRPTIY
jgi:hypothetical protein